MTKIRMFCIRGLFGGEPFEFSHGMDTLAQQANRKFPGLVSATGEGMSLDPVWGIVGNLTQACIASHRSGRLQVLVGHSYGAYAAMVIAHNLMLHGIKTALLVMDDTTIDSPLVPETGGERLLYFQKVDPMGGGNPDSVANATTPVRRIQKSMAHIQMDDDPQIHADILTEVGKLLGA